MRRLFVTLVVLGLTVTLAAPAFCGERVDYGYGWGPGHMMGAGYGWGPSHMMHYGHRGWGMHGHGWGWDQSPRGWRSMQPEQQEKWEKIRNTHLMDTLELRKQLAAKRIELETLWVQPNLDRAKVEKLSKEVAELQAQLQEKRDQYLLRCRQEFGNQDWVCPGSGW